MKTNTELKKENEKLKAQLKEAEKVIDELINCNEQGANQWAEAWSPNDETKAQKSIRIAREYKAKYGGEDE